MTDTKHRLLACALLMCMMVCVFAGLAATPAEAADVRAVNWMENVPDETKLSSMSIPGTHDSCTQNVDMRYIFQCQDASIATQLKYGYRYLDMRLVLEKRSGQETLVLKHNIARCKVSDSPFARTLTLADVLKDVYAFLDEHPSETVIMCMKAENSKDDVAAVQKALYEMIDQASERWYLKNEIPTLGAVRGRIVLATRFDDKLQVGSDRWGCTSAGRIRAIAPFSPTPLQSPRSTAARRCTCRIATTTTLMTRSPPSEPASTAAGQRMTPSS